MGTGYRRGYSLQQIEDITLPSVRTFEGTPMSPTVGTGNKSVFYFNQDGEMTTLCDKLGRTDDGIGMIATKLKYGKDYAVFVSDTLVEEDRILTDMRKGEVTFKFEPYKRHGTHQDSSLPDPPSTALFIPVTGSHVFDPGVEEETTDLFDPNTDFIELGVKRGMTVTNLTTSISGTINVVNATVIKTENSNLLWHEDDEYVVENVVKVRDEEETGTYQTAEDVKQDLVDFSKDFTTDVFVGFTITNNTTGFSGTVTEVSQHIIKSDNVNLVWQEGDEYAISGTENVSLDRDVLVPGGLWTVGGRVYEYPRELPPNQEDKYELRDDQVNFNNQPVRAGMSITVTTSDGSVTTEILEVSRGIQVQEESQIANLAGSRAVKHTHLLLLKDTVKVGGVGATYVITGTITTDITGIFTSELIANPIVLFDSTKDFIDAGVEQGMSIENVITGEIGTIDTVKTNYVIARKQDDSSEFVTWQQDDTYIITKGVGRETVSVKGVHTAPPVTEIVQNTFLQDLTPNFIAKGVRENMIVKNITKAESGIIRGIESHKLWAVLSEEYGSEFLEWEPGDTYLIDGEFFDPTPEPHTSPEDSFLYDGSVIFLDDTNIRVGLTRLKNLTTSRTGIINKIGVHKLYAIDNTDQQPMTWVQGDEYEVEGDTNGNAPAANVTVTCNYYTRTQVALDPYYENAKSSALDIPTILGANIFPRRRFGRPFSNL